MSDAASVPAEPVTFRRPWRWLPSVGAPAVAIGALASYAIFRFVANGGSIAHWPAELVDGAAFLLVDVAVVIGCLLAARSSRGDAPTRRAWLLLACASIASGTAANLSQANELLHPGTSLGLWYHGFFAFAYVATIGGLLSFPIAPRRRADRITMSFDIATVALSGAMVLWYWCVRTGAFGGTTSLSKQLIVIGYPSADLAVLLTSAILLVRSSDDRSRRIFGLFGLAYLCSSVADFWYGYLQSNGATFERTTLIDVFWFAGVLLLTVAAVSQLHRPPQPDLPRRVAVRWIAEIPFIAVGVAFAMLFLAMREDRENVEVQLSVGALIMTFLAIGRQRVSARDAALLMDERATRDTRFRALVQNSSDVVTVLDSTLRASYVSPAIQGVLGLDAELGIGKTFIEWVVAEDRQSTAIALERVAAVPYARALLRCRMVHSDGSLRDMETVASNLLEDPAVEGIVLNSRDISQRTALEQQLQHAQKMEVVGQFAGGIAHDFNNLLMVIGANAEFVLSEDSDAGARREAADEIMSTTKRAAALTKQLLSFSRKQESSPAVIDPNDIVRHVERMLLRLMQHAARFSTDLADSPSSVEIDPGQLEQALLNLAVNSRDAMPAGGLLRMRTRNVRVTQRTKVERGVLLPGNYVAISVEDDGSGMSAETQRRIFDPFFTTKPIGSGTGLGLAMVLGVVQQAGGQIQVRSAPGEGSCITLYLPAVCRPARHSAERPQAASMRGTGRILVVDDEEGVRTVLQRLLRRIGYEVDAVGDAGTALAMLAVTPLRFDLVLSDILMPVKTGLELASEIMDSDVDVAVVLMTGFADSATVREATELRSLQVLRKPFEVEQLAVILEEALARRESSRIHR